MKTSKWILVTPSLFVAVLNGIVIGPPAPARLFDRGLFDTRWTSRGINRTFACAVRSGDVVAPIPEPSAMLLFGPALQGVN